MSQNSTLNNLLEYLLLMSPSEDAVKHMTHVRLVTLTV